MRFQDLIDYFIEMEESSGLAGNTPEQFRMVLINYIFKEETYESKSFTAFLEKFEMPAFLAGSSSLLDVDIEELRTWIEDETINSSLCGKLFLSTPFLKSFYPHQPPSFNQLSPDVRAEVLNRIKDTNRDIVEAFEKLKADMEADRKRTVMAIIAFIIKNVHKATEFPLNRLEKKAQDVIREIYPSADDIYSATARQNAELGDEGRMKDLIKAFFAIRKFQHISEISEHCRGEFERYKKRTLRALK